MDDFRQTVESSIRGLSALRVFSDNPVSDNNTIVEQTAERNNEEASSTATVSSASLSGWNELRSLVIKMLLAFPLENTETKESSLYLTREDILNPSDAGRINVRKAVVGVMHECGRISAVSAGHLVLMFVSFGESYSEDMEPAGVALWDTLARIKDRMPNPACGKTWGRDAMIVTCQTCASDQTCCFCMECFENSNHVGHDYRIHSSAGGMCDCGDPEAWDPQGFCDKHSGSRDDFEPSEVLSPLGELYSSAALRGLFDVVASHTVELCRNDVVSVLSDQPNEWTAEELADRRRSSIIGGEDEYSWTALAPPIPTHGGHLPVRTERVQPAMLGALAAQINSLQELVDSGNSELWGCMMSRELKAPAQWCGTDTVTHGLFEKLTASESRTATTLDLLFLLHNFIPQTLRLLEHKWYHSIVPSYAFKRVAVEHFTVHYPQLLHESGQRAAAPSRWHDDGCILDLGAQILTVPSVCESVANTENIVTVAGVGCMGYGPSLPQNILSIVVGELGGVLARATPPGARFVDFAHQLIEGGAYWVPYIDTKYIIQNSVIAESIVGFVDQQFCLEASHPNALAWAHCVVPHVITRIHGSFPQVRRGREELHVAREPSFLNAINFELNVLRLCEVVATHIKRCGTRGVSDTASAELALHAFSKNAVLPPVQALAAWFSAPENDDRFSSVFCVGATHKQLHSALGSSRIAERSGVSVHITLHRTLATLLRAVHTSLHVAETSVLDDILDSLRTSSGHLMYSSQEFAVKLLEEPLRVLAFLSQVELGLWVRNGSTSMTGYATRYECFAAVTFMSPGFVEYANFDVSCFIFVQLCSTDTSLSYFTSPLYAPKSLERDVMILRLCARILGVPYLIRRAVELFGCAPTRGGDASSLGGDVHSVEPQWLRVLQNNGPSSRPSSCDASKVLRVLETPLASTHAPPSSVGTRARASVALAMERAVAAVRALATQHMTVDTEGSASDSDDADADLSHDMEDVEGYIDMWSREDGVHAAELAQVAADVHAAGQHASRELSPPDGDHARPPVISSNAHHSSTESIPTEMNEPMTYAGSRSSSPFIDFGVLNVALVEFARRIIDKEREPTLHQELTASVKDLAEDCAVRVGSVSDLVQSLCMIIFDTLAVDETDSERLRLSLIHELAAHPLTHSQLVRRIPSHLTKLPDFDDVLLEVAEKTREAVSHAMTRSSHAQKYQLKSDSWKDFSGVFWKRYSKTDLEHALQAFDEQDKSSVTALGPLPLSVAELLRERRDLSACGLAELVCREIFELSFGILRAAVSAKSALLVEKAHSIESWDPRDVGCVVEARLKRSAHTLQQANADFSPVLLEAWDSHVIHTFEAPLRGVLVMLKVLALDPTALSEFLKNWYLVEHNRDHSVVSLLCLLQQRLKEANSSERPIARHAEGVARLVHSILADLTILHESIASVVALELPPSTANLAKRGSEETDGKLPEVLDTAAAKRQRVKDRQASLMRQFQERQQQFAASQAAQSDSHEDMELGADSDTCCLCHEHDTSVNTVGLCAFAFRHSVIGRFHKISGVVGELLNPELQEAAPFGTVASCGHLMHEHCLERYRATLLTAPTSSREIIRPGEFACPMCRALCNVLLPLETATVSENWRGSISQFDTVMRNTLTSWHPLIEHRIVGYLAAVCTSVEFENRVDKVGFRVDFASTSKAVAWRRIVRALWSASVHLQSVPLTRLGIERVRNEPFADVFFEALKEITAHAASSEQQHDIEVCQYLRPFWLIACRQAMFSACLTGLQKSPQNLEDLHRLWDNGFEAASMVDPLVFSPAKPEILSLPGFVLPFLRRSAFLVAHLSTNAHLTEALLEYWAVSKIVDSPSRATVSANASPSHWPATRLGAALTKQEAELAFNEANSWCALLGWPPLFSCLFEEKNHDSEMLLTNYLERTQVASASPADLSFVLPSPLPHALRLVPLPANFEDALATGRKSVCSLCGKQPRACAVCLLCGIVICVGSDGRTNESTPEALLHARNCGCAIILGNDLDRAGTAGQPLLLFVPVDAAVFALRDAPSRATSGAIAGTFVPSPYVDKWGEEDIGFSRGRPLTLDEDRYDAIARLWASAGGEHTLLRVLGSNLYRL